MAQGIDLARLGGEPLARFPVADERIVDLAEGILNGALVGHEELLLLRLGLLDRTLNGTGGEDGPTNCQVWVEPMKRSERSTLEKPKRPVSAILG
jgi:hypothetical protein